MVKRMRLLLVGGMFARGAEAIMTKGLKQGARVYLVPEPENPYDACAVRVEVPRGSIKQSAELDATLLGFGMTWDTLPERVVLGHLGAKRETKAAKRAAQAGHTFDVVAAWHAWREAPKEGTLEFTGSGDVFVVCTAGAKGSTQ